MYEYIEGKKKKIKEKAIMFCLKIKGRNPLQKLIFTFTKTLFIFKFVISLQGLLTIQKLHRAPFEKFQRFLHQ